MAGTWIRSGLGLIAGVFCAIGAAQARNAPKPPLLLSVRPAKGTSFRAGEGFSCWLELKNVSSRAVAVKANLSVASSYSQGDLAGGSGGVHWAPCLSETRVVLPGQSLRQPWCVSHDDLKPGRALLDFAVDVRAAHADGSCAETVYDLKASRPVRVLPAKASAGAASPTPCGEEADATSEPQSPAPPRQPPASPGAPRAR